MKNYITKIINIKGSWQEILNDSRFTVHKRPLNKSPTENFIKKILIAEHSTIRTMLIKWIWDDIPSWVATHWVRHKWECFVTTQRSDRTGVNRDKLPQDTPVSFMGEANIQNLIDTMRKRLCGASSYQTQCLALSLKKEISNYDEYVGGVLVPNCVYRCGCPEINSCGLWENLIKTTNGKILTDNIWNRYNLYNTFLNQKGKKE